MLRFVRQVVPAARHNLRRLVAKGKGYLPSHHRLQCPVCGTWVRNFDPFGLVPRPDALCLWCGALERHRLVWLFLQRRTDLFDGRTKRMLHFAPERCFSSRFSRVPGLEYTTADLNGLGAAVKADITDLPFPNESFDVIYCSHVLEHVPDDRKAMRECFRVLKPGGWAVMMVPIGDSATFEDPTVIDPKERERLFGQFDHVRQYGPDFADRLRDAGFEVTVHGPVEVAGDDATRFGIPESEWPIFFCRRS